MRIEPMRNDNQHNNISELEIIGKALYGEVWIAQLSRQLKSIDGQPLPQSTLKSMRDRHNLPEYIRTQLRSLTDKRLGELVAMKNTFFNNK